MSWFGVAAAHGAWCQTTVPSVSQMTRMLRAFIWRPRSIASVMLANPVRTRVVDGMYPRMPEAIRRYVPRPTRLWLPVGMVPVPFPVGCAWW